MGEKINRLILLVLAFALSLALSILLFPIVILLVVVIGILTCITIYRRRRFPQEPPKKKGTVEILPAEKNFKKPVRSTTDTELEITIETLQQKSKTRNQIDDEKEP